MIEIPQKNQKCLNEKGNQCLIAIDPLQDH